MCLILNVSIHMHVLHVIFYNNLTNYLYFIIKIAFNFKCIHVFAWVTCWFQNRIQKQQFRTKGVVISRHGKTGQNFLTQLELDFFDLKQKHVDP